MKPRFPPHATLLLGMAALMIAAQALPWVWARLCACSALAAAAAFVLRRAWSRSESHAAEAERAAALNLAEEREALAREREEIERRAEAAILRAEGELKAAAAALAPGSQAIPVLTDQLNAVIEATDKAAMDLIEAFKGINRKAKAQAKEVEEAYRGSKEGACGQGIFDRNREVLQGLLRDFSSLTSGLEALSSEISGIYEGLGSMGGVVDKIDQVQETTRILALNAGIVAARAGEHGRAFGVVAKEVKALSDLSSDSVDKVRGIMAAVSERTRALLEAASRAVQDNMSLSAKMEQDIDGIIRAIDEKAAELGRRLEGLQNMTEELGADIARVVVSIQFQDITRQRIEHVIEPLAVMGRELEQILPRLGDQETPGESLEKRLGGIYTMEGERELLRAALGRGEKDK
jgi:methyl-accepting chemotaxis protein